MARAWLPTCTAEERAAMVTVWRMGGTDALRDLMGDNLGALRRQAEQLQRAATPRSGEGPPPGGEVRLW